MATAVSTIPTLLVVLGEKNLIGEMLNVLGRVAQIGLTGKKKVPELGEMW